MKITDKRNIDNRCAFNELAHGDVFEYGGVIHMRVAGSNLVNAVKLSVNVGTAVCFGAYEIVTPLKAELIIYDEQGV